MVREFVERVFDGSARPLLVHLVEDKKLTPADLRRLARALEREAAAAEETKKR
jgi:predicted transcriptional regulator